MIEKHISIFRTIQSNPGVAATPPPFSKKRQKASNLFSLVFAKMDGRMDIETDRPIYGQTKREMDTHLFSQPTSSMPWGRRSAIWDPGDPHQTPQTAIHTTKATQFSLSTFNVGKDPFSRPKIANDNHLFSQPTSSMPGECRLAIWDPKGPHQTPQTAIHTPKATRLSLSTFKVGKDPSSRPKITNDTHLFSQPTSSVPWGRRLAIWDPGGPHQTPQTAIHTPKRPDFP